MVFDLRRAKKMEHIYTGAPAADFTSDAKTRVSSPGNQAYQILRLGFIVAPVVAGLDKFFHLHSHSARSRA